jgi:hypothetical protein
LLGPELAVKLLPEFRRRLFTAFEAQEVFEGDLGPPRGGAIGCSAGFLRKMIFVWIHQRM